MPNLVAYNPGGLVPNALQFGTIVMDVNNTVNQGSLIWCPDYGICNQYFIITDSYTNGKTSQVNSRAMGFPTTGLTDSALILSINKLAASKSSGPFTGLTGAITWAISEGYFIINQEYPSIVTSGCVLNLDASLPASYPLVFSNWYDLSGNGNTGTLSGATYSSSSYGNLVFNSSNSDYVSFASTSNIPSGNNNYTISTWFNPSSLGTKGLVGWGNYGTTNQVNSFRLSATGLVNSWQGNDLSVTTSLSTGTWYNAVATFNGITREIWVNSVSVGSDTPTSHNVTTTSNLTIGRTNNSEYFDGSIGEVQIFNRALTSTEITQNYNALLPRYNGTYVDPCNAAPFCTPTPTSTLNVTPTQTPTPTICPVPTLYLTSTSSNDACNQINGQFLTNISHTDSFVCPYCNWTTLNSTEIPFLSNGTYYVSDGTNVRSWTKTSTPSVLYNPSACSSCPLPTPTPTKTPTPTPTSGTTTPTPTVTPSITPAGIQATIEFSFFDSGSGVIRASMEVISGVTLDSLSWSGTGIGYSALGCSGTENTQAFNDVLGIGNTQITTEVWGSISAILSAQNQTSSFAVNGNTINTVSETIIVGGHSYLITQVTDCFSPL